MACETIRTPFYVFYVFFQNPPKRYFLRFFELLHTFSRTLEAVCWGWERLCIVICTQSYTWSCRQCKRSDDHNNVGSLHVCRYSSFHTLHSPLRIPSIPGESTVIVYITWTLGHTNNTAAMSPCIWREIYVAIFDPKVNHSANAGPWYCQL